MANPAPLAEAPTGLVVRELGATAYEPTFAAMRRFTDARDEKTVDEVWLTEHLPVFTQGQATLLIQSAMARFELVDDLDAGFSILSGSWSTAAAGFEGGTLPVILLPSCAMVPKMSRSGLFGVRPAEEG